MELSALCSVQDHSEFLKLPDCRRPLTGSSKPTASGSPSLPRLPLEARRDLASCPLAKACIEVMLRKRSNLSVAADVATVAQLLQLAHQVCAL